MFPRNKTKNSLLRMLKISTQQQKKHSPPIVVKWMAPIYLLDTDSI